MRRLMMAALFLLSAVGVVLASGCGGPPADSGSGTPNSKQLGKEKR